MCQWRCLLAVLGQGQDAGEWVNILIIVVVAVFWVIGGLAKSLTAKNRRQDGNRVPKHPGPLAHGPRHKRETLLQQLARKAEQFQAAAAEHAREAERRAHQRRPHRGLKPARDLVSPARRPAPAATPTTDESINLTPDLSAVANASASRKSQQHELSPTVDLRNRETLRQAILHYEILGKPLALREPFE